jgi:CRP-like cAMP-binding protein
LRYYLVSENLTRDIWYHTYMAFISKLVQWRQNFLLAEVNHSDDIDSTVGWCGKVCSNLHRAASAWLNTFVISISPNNGEWHFRTLFVAEITILPVVLSFLFVFWWVLNRNTRMRKTRGSSIPHKEDDSDYDDDDDDDDDEIDDGATIKSQTKIRKRKALERQKLQALRKAYDVEIEHDDDDDDDDDDDGDDNETILSADSSLEDSDYDEDNLPYSQSSSSTINTDTDKTASQMFLSEEKAGLLKVVREIPILSFFNEEAMAMCMNDIEYINLDKTNDLLWDEGKFDGSLYYIVEGKIRVNFLDFEAPPADQRDHRKKEVASVIHEEETVVTSLLALMEGMVQSHLSEKGSLDRFVGLPVKRTTAQAIEDCTRLLRIPPSCFSRILDRFPETILRIVQTTLNRTQRVTVQTLVRCCGLRQELLVPTNKKLKKSMLAVRSSHWNPLQITLAKLNKNSDVDLENISDNDNKSLMKNACAAFASVLGIEESATIEVLEEKCSLITLDTQGDESSRILLEAGSNHGSCYLLLQGAMEIGLHLPLGGFSSKQLQNDANAWDFQRIEIISPGSILGESALFTTDINLFEIRACVPASEYCNKPAILLRIPKDVYAHLVVKHPQAMAISLVPVLSVLSPVVHLLTWTTEWMHVEAAREIVHKGSPCNSLYIVLNGRLRATNRSKARNRVLGGATSNVVPPEEYGRGKIFGQVGSLANVDWPFDVFAIRQSELAKVPIKTLEIVVQNYPHAGLFLARVVASHVESLYFSKRTQTAPTSSFAENRPVRRVSTIETDSQRSRIPKPLPYNLPSYGLNLATIAVVPLSYNIDLKRFCNTFFKAMQTIAPCKLLTKSFVKQELGEKVYNNRNALHDLKMTRLLADVEENNRVVIYQADPKFTFWTRLSVLQADCILLVVDSQHAPETSRVEQTLAWAYEAMDVRIELVVVGKEETKLDKNDETDIDEDEDDKVSVSDQLNNWSESRKWIAGHHLVRAPFGRYRIDFRRMCRRITGRSVGLVLGAGGARGIAHLGKSIGFFLTLFIEPILLY